MTLEQYRAISAELLLEAAHIEDSKRPAYTLGSEDVLVNFKTVAARLGVPPGQVLATYFLKHVDAVTAALMRPDLPQAERVLSRFADAVNYLKLGYALLHDLHNEGLTFKDTEGPGLEEDDIPF